MNTTKKVYLVVGAVFVALLVALWLQPRVKEALAPVPLAAFAAIEVEGSGLAVVGPVEIPAGTPFRLRAVLEAQERDGGSIYYSEAEALSIGGTAVAAEQLRRWHGADEVKALWFTVEPRSAFLQLEGSEPGVAVRFEEFFHPEWSTLWTVDGFLDSRSSEQVAGRDGQHPRFGTQRYQVWIELYSEDNRLVPKERYKSWGAGDLLDRVTEFPTVTAQLPGVAAPASAAFGLIGVGLPPNPSAELLERISIRARQRLLFTQVSVLRGILGVAGQDVEDVEWRNVELSAGLSWAEQVSQGDLVRVGARIVVLHEDANENGLLDPDDFCLDFEVGAAKRRLADVFPGEGEVEWAHLGT